VNGPEKKAAESKETHEEAKQDAVDDRRALRENSNEHAREKQSHKPKQLVETGRQRVLLKEELLEPKQSPARQESTEVWGPGMPRRQPVASNGEVEGPHRSASPWRRGRTIS
jgi:hypothetical protein